MVCMKGPFNKSRRTSDASVSGSDGAHSGARMHSGARARSTDRSTNRSANRSTDRSTDRSASDLNAGERSIQDRYSASRYGRQPSARHYVEGSADAKERYDRDRVSSRYAATRKERKRKKTLKRIGLGALAVILCGAGLALLYFGDIMSKLNSGVSADLRSALVKTDLANEPFYMLLLGTDGSEERDASEEYAGVSRSDSIILARIDVPNGTVTLISIHRDTLVDLGEYGENKLNAAYTLGGAALAVQAVSELAGVDISHYAEINFDGFAAAVDALGGVEVEVPIEIDDDDAGGHLDAGLQTLSGSQALILCRSRHTYDDYSDGDSYRAANQRLVLSAIAKKLLASDIVTMATTVESMADYVTTDLSLLDIIGLAQALQGFDPDTSLYSAMQPTISEYIDNIWYEITDEDAWEEMMSRVKAGLPPTEEDEVDEYTGTILATTGSGSISTTVENMSGTVLVLNGNGVEGSASAAAELLEAVGYTVDTANATAFGYTSTLVVYADADQASEAKIIARVLGVGTAQINNGAYTYDEDFLVILGSDWE